ncbi:MAG: hypothetical protein WD468_05560 [Pirellulales bacterium]
MQASIEVRIPDDAAFLTFELSVLNAGNNDTLLVALGDQVIGEVDLASQQAAGTGAVELWIGDQGGQTTTLSWYMPSDIPSSAEFLVSNVEFGIVSGLHESPTVVEIRLRGSTWDADMPSHVVPIDGTGTLPIPWVNVDRVEVVFDKSVFVPPEALTASGVNVASYPPRSADADGFSFDSNTLTATWTFEQSIGADKVTIRIDGDSLNPVRDIVGNALAGSGSPGTDFALQFSVLPGDVDQNRTTDQADFRAVRARQFSRAVHATYDPLHDLDGSRAISVFDLVLVRNNLFSTLPDAEPVAGSPSAGQTAGQLASSPAVDSHVLRATRRRAAVDRAIVEVWEPGDTPAARMIAVRRRR